MSTTSARSEDSMLVVIVDDDDTLREALIGLFESSGLPSIAFASAEDFSAAWPDLQIGCMLLDFQLPGMNGLALQAKLLQGPEPPPVVFLSSHDRPALRESALRDGARCYLTKPVDSSRLLGAVFACLGVPPAELRLDDSG